VARSPSTCGSCAAARHGVLPGIRLPESIVVTGELASRPVRRGGLLLVRHAARGWTTLQPLAPAADLPTVVWLCKGFERESGMLPHQSWPTNCRTSGWSAVRPSFADELRAAADGADRAAAPIWCGSHASLHGDPAHLLTQEWIESRWRRVKT